jgi:excisionase family DNA binding protein
MKPCPSSELPRVVPADFAALEGVDLPDFLTVEEAARVLRIGRTSAYALAARYEETHGAEGLPVVRVGRLLRVPRARLEELAGGQLRGLAVQPPAPVLLDVSGPNVDVAEATQLTFPSTAA